MTLVEEERAKSRWGSFQFMTMSLSAILVDFSLLVLNKQPVCTKSGHEPRNSQIYKFMEEFLKKYPNSYPNTNATITISGQINWKKV